MNIYQEYELKKAAIIAADDKDYEEQIKAIKTELCL